ncbi:MAG: sulfotransferase [Chloroflexi bacterium]|nr:sulfotransferase [Chloroflexota bacterium]
MPAGKPILVTGSHRSGSTWTGRMIAASSKVVYLQEPFNSHYFDPGICSYYFDEPFQYITEENSVQFYDCLKRTAGLKYNLLAGLQHARSGPQYAQVFNNMLAFKIGRLQGKRPLFKDPFAVFSSPWLAEQFGMDVVMVIRHPAAFVSSVKRMQWESPVWIMYQREDLMRDYFEPLREEMKAFLSAPKSIVEQAAYFWKLIYFSVYQNQQKYPDWYFVRHEDLSLAPEKEFRSIFERLSLPFDAAVEKTVLEYTNLNNPDEAPEQQTVYRLNSAENIRNWQHRLTAEEVAQIRHFTTGVWEYFYTGADW